MSDQLVVRVLGCAKKSWRKRSVDVRLEEERSVAAPFAAKHQTASPGGGGVGGGAHTLVH